jgi:hypothetical protein
MVIYMRKAMFIIILALLVFSASSARADLSAKSAFILLEKVPPGEYYPDARQFLGPPSAERTVDIEDGVKITRWGKSADSWTFEVLHDADQVRAVRITWRTASKSDRQRIFSQITTAGKKFFGSTAIFKNMEEAQWEDFEGRWITRAKIEDGSGKVTLLSGIRDAAMGSDRYGF